MVPMRSTPLARTRALRDPLAGLDPHELEQSRARGAVLWDANPCASCHLPGQATAEFSEGILRGHAAEPEEIVGTALYLASSDSDYLTGQVIMIDGGMVLV